MAYAVKQGIMVVIRFYYNAAYTHVELLTDLLW